MTPFSTLTLAKRAANVTFVAALFMLLSCNSAQKLQKATDKVLQSPQALDQVWVKVREQRPCVNDTSAPVVHEYYDTITLPPSLALTAAEAAAGWNAGPTANLKFITDNVPKLLIRHVDTSRYVKDQEALTYLKDSMLYYRSNLQYESLRADSLFKSNSDLQRENLKIVHVAKWKLMGLTLLFLLLLLWLTGFGRQLLTLLKFL